MATSLRPPFRIAKASPFTIDKHSNINAVLKTQNIIVKPDALQKGKAKFTGRIAQKKAMIVSRREPERNVKITAFKKRAIEVAATLKNKYAVPVSTHKAELKKFLSDGVFFTAHYGHHINKRPYLNPSRKRDLNTEPVKFIVTVKKPLTLAEMQAKLVAAFDLADASEIERRGIVVAPVFANYKVTEYYTLTFPIPLEYVKEGVRKVAKALTSVGGFKSTVESLLPYIPGFSVLFPKSPKAEKEVRDCCCCCCCDEKVGKDGSSDIIKESARPIYQGIPNDLEWHLKQTRVFEAWALKPPTTGKAKGEGIVIAHPDTGWREHFEYRPGTENILRDLYFDVKANRKGSSAAQHPVAPQIPPLFPTHGTATGSVIVSKEANGKTIVDHVPTDKGATRSDARITGVAPNASLLPIRCVESVILHPQDTSLQRAIEYAIEQKVHVISISLGGVPHRSLEDIINTAVLDKKHDIIVVAAAGQYVDALSFNNSVVEPGAYTNVIAATGSTPSAHPWTDACHGPDVDIVAPAKGVWFADFRDNGDKVICWGEGTSFAAPQVAGIAALWLAFWGRDYLRTRYPNKPLAHVFRHIIMKTAWKPRASWNSNLWGAGIIDAKAVLSETLPSENEVPSPTKQGETTFSGVTGFLAWLDEKRREGQAAVSEGIRIVEEMGGEFLDLIGAKEAFDYWEQQATTLWGMAEDAAGTAQTELNNMANAAAEKAEEAAEAVEELIETLAEKGEEAMDAVGDLAEAAGDAAEDGADAVVNVVTDVFSDWW